MMHAEDGNICVKGAKFVCVCMFANAGGGGDRVAEDGCDCDVWGCAGTRACVCGDFWLLVLLYFICGLFHRGPDNKILVDKTKGGKRWVS